MTKEKKIRLSDVSKEPYSLDLFLALFYFARLATGGKKGNFYEVQLTNKWYTADIKVTIDEIVSESDKKNFEYLLGGVDIDKLIDDFKEAGLIQEEQKEDD